MVRGETWVRLTSMTLRLRLIASETCHSWSYGADRLQLTEDIKAMQRLMAVAKFDHGFPAAALSSRATAMSQQPTGPAALSARQQNLQRLLLLHLENEIQRLSVWNNPLEDGKRGSDPVLVATRAMSSVSLVFQLSSATA
jgi:phosphatidylinositol 4-kinase